MSASPSADRDSPPPKGAERHAPEFQARLLSPGEAMDNEGNRSWWERNPMIYDWEGELGETAPTPEYFSAIDEIFGEGHSLLNNPRWPAGDILEEFIPYRELSGRKVLEIGCGAGLVASHLARAGADLSAIDLTERAVALTRRRFELSGLNGNIQRMDAEKMTFPDDSFDFVVSWGVIHHSGNMQAILDGIHRVLKPGGRAYLMVYNRHSLRYQVYCRFWLGVLRGRLFRQTLEEINGSITDGYVARHLTAGEFREMASRFPRAEFSFSDEKLTILHYLFGTGAPFRRIPGLTRGLERWLARNWGWYLHAVLTK